MLNGRGKIDRPGPPVLEGDKPGIFLSRVGARPGDGIRRCQQRKAGSGRHKNPQGICHVELRRPPGYDNLRAVGVQVGLDECDREPDKPPRFEGFQRESQLDARVRDQQGVEPDQAVSQVGQVHEQGAGLFRKELIEMQLFRAGTQLRSGNVGRRCFPGRQAVVPHGGRLGVEERAEHYC
ncbi:hypothetical protein ES708_30185 [subsurface metagenome]